MSRSAADLDTLLAAYRTLDVAVRASAQAIRFRYRELVRQHHPDRFAAGSPEQARAQERMREINAAYDLIEAAPLQHHQFASEPLDAPPPRPGPLDRPVSVAVETFARFGMGVLLGLLIVAALHRRRVPGVEAYGFIIPMVVGLACTSTSASMNGLIRWLWWWS